MTGQHPVARAVGLVLAGSLLGASLLGGCAGPPERPGTAAGPAGTPSPAASTASATAPATASTAAAAGPGAPTGSTTGAGTALTSDAGSLEALVTSPALLASLPAGFHELDPGIELSATDTVRMFGGPTYEVDLTHSKVDPTIVVRIGPPFPDERLAELAPAPLDVPATSGVEQVGVYDSSPPGDQVHRALTINTPQVAVQVIGNDVPVETLVAVVEDLLHRSANG